MNQNLEPGCLCIIVNSKGSNDGLYCRLEGWYGYSEKHQEECWRIDRKIPTFNKSGLLRCMDDLVPPKNLMRIDDPDLKKDKDLEAPPPKQPVMVRI